MISTSHICTEGLKKVNQLILTDIGLKGLTGGPLSSGGSSSFVISPFCALSKAANLQCISILEVT